MPTRHPILVDTSALIAVAMTECWEIARSSLKLTTTNVVKGELNTHIQNNSEYAFEGTREHRLHHGSKRAKEALEDDATNFTVVTSVPRPRGEDAGEESLLQEVEQNPGSYRYIILNDSGYRDRFRDKARDNGLNYTVAPPPHLLYFLFDNDKIGKPEFCSACAELIQGEGWTSQGAIHEMWRTIPVDCTGHAPDEYLPDYD